MKDNQGFLKQAIIDAGGTAYPMPDPLTAMPNNQNELMFFATDMTLRGRFALAAMQGWVATFSGDGLPNEVCAAALSYRLADAMLAERMK